jgi:23S rRNA (uracil1939-C5)-methyltransferase
MAHPHAVPCPELAQGCGGCPLGEIPLAEQRQRRLELVQRQLAGVVPDPEAIDLVPLPGWGWRTTVRAAVVNGRAGFRKRRSNDVVVVSGCPITHPVLEHVLTTARFDGCTEVTLRIGAATGQVLVVASPTATEVDVSDVTAIDPDSIRVVGVDELDAGKRAWYFDELAGRRWRISAQSFFQSRPDGAALLVQLVREWVATGGTPAHLVDLYSGVGLFAGTIPAERVTAVENNRSSCADARVNLGDVDAKIVISDVDRWHAARADLVVADPARRGLGGRGVGVIDRTRTPRAVLISCDLGSAARDLAALTAVGFSVNTVTAVDLFPHTELVEIVTTLSR